MILPHNLPLHECCIRVRRLLLPHHLPQSAVLEWEHCCCRTSTCHWVLYQSENSATATPPPATECCSRVTEQQLESSRYPTGPDVERLHNNNRCSLIIIKWNEIFVTSFPADNKHYVIKHILFLHVIRSTVRVDCIEITGIKYERMIIGK